MPLLYVLWTVALLTIIATATLGSGTVAYRQTRNLAEAARLEALAEAAVNRAVLALLDTRADRRWRVDSVSQSFAFADMPVTVIIQDELGRVDINHADSPLLIAAFRAAGLSPQAAAETADKILDWRDKGQVQRLRGAKAAEYAAAGVAYSPRNAPFQSVDELKLVLGITPKIFARVEPLLTVYSGRPAIDPQFAPRPLLDALAGKDGAPSGFQNILARSPMPSPSASPRWERMTPFAKLWFASQRTPPSHIGCSTGELFAPSKNHLDCWVRLIRPRRSTSRTRSPDLSKPGCFA